MSYLKVNGGNIYYKILGAGEPIILLHGGPGLTHEYFKSFMSCLNELNYRAITFDQRGNGKSNSFDPRCVTIDEIVEDIEAIRREMKLDKINLFGHSFGTRLCLDYTKKFPNRINKVILCSPTPMISDYFHSMNNNLLERMNMNEESMKRVSEAMMRGNKKAINEFMEESILKQFKEQRKGLEFLQEMKEYELDIDRFMVINQKLIQEHFSQLVQKEYRFDNETLILHGDYDAIPLESSKKVMSFFKNGKLEVIKDSGHYPFIEKKDKVIKILQGFMSS